jgi:hypothetical protein
MTIHMNIDAEDDPRAAKLDASRHVLNIKNVDAGKRKQVRENVSLDLKEEIKHRNKKDGRICIVGELPRSKQGLGRAPMILGAVLMIFALNVAQLAFLGQKEGGEALALASEAFTSLKVGGGAFLSGEEGAPSVLFADAQASFEMAENMGGFLLKHNSEWLPEPEKVQSLRNILDAGELMASIGTHMDNVNLALQELPEEGSLTDYIRTLSETEIEPALNELKQVLTHLNDVDLTGTGYSQTFIEYRGKLEELNEITSLWMDVKEPLLTALGDRYPQHYLIMFGNNDEMRTGGPFVGSIAIAQLNDGRLESLDFQDVYQMDNQYFEHVEVPAPELRELTTEWRLRDSLLSPDFPTSAEYARHFLDIYPNAPSVDGVIMVSLSAAQGMLEEVGDLTLPSLPKPLSAEHFPVVLSTFVEAKTFGETTPKVILGEVIDAFLGKITDQATRAKLGLRILSESKKEQVLFYHENPQVQELLESVGMAGDMPKLSELEGDYFMPLVTNIGGNKTDRYIETQVHHDSHLFHDGSMVSSARVTRTHGFNEATLGWMKKVMAEYGFYEWNEGLEKILGNTPNRTGMRLYVPEGAQILEVRGDYHRDDLQFYYDKDQDHSYYYLDQTLAPGETRSIELVYSLPWRMNGDFDEYNFRLFKQPGLKGVTFEKTVAAPEDILLSSHPVSTMNREDKDYVIGGDFKTDLELTLLYR